MRDSSRESDALRSAAPSDVRHLLANTATRFRRGGGSGGGGGGGPGPGTPVSLELVPSTFSVFEGATYTELVAIIRDADDNILDLEPTSYEIDDTDVATINTSTGATTGAVGGAAAGPTTSIRARYAPASLVSNDVTVTTQVPSEGHPNEPAGMTMLQTHDGTTLEPAGWFNASGNVSIVTDPDKGSVLQLGYVGTTVPGSGQARLDASPEIGGFGATRIYISFWEKISLGFQGNNGSGSLKNVIMHTQSTYGGDPNGGIHLPALLNNPADLDSRIRIFLSFVQVTDFDGEHVDPPNNRQALSPDSGDILARGSWHFIECLVDFNSRGNIDGQVQCWVDGALVASATGIKCQIDAGSRQTGFTLSNVWGGGGTPIEVDQYYRFKDIYVSGGFARSGERPDHWVITSPVEGLTVPAGTLVHMIAQLVDENDASVDIFGGYLGRTVDITNGGTLELWDGVPIYANSLVAGEHGRYPFAVQTSSTPGTSHVVTIYDYGRQNNGSLGDYRVGTATITTT